MSTANAILAQWADDPSDLNTIAVAADAFFDAGLHDEEFTARWMVRNSRFPGQRVEVKRKPWFWLFDIRLSYYRHEDKRLRKYFPNAILSKKLSYDMSPSKISFARPIDAFNYLEELLKALRQRLGIPVSTMPTELSC